MVSRYNPDDVLRFVATYKTRTGGQSPTLRQICEAVGIPSTSQASTQLDILENMGKVERIGYGESRSIRLRGERYLPPPQFRTDVLDKEK